MEVIIYVASRVWCFFSLLGQLGVLPLSAVLGDSYILIADNPFNSFRLTADVAFGDGVFGTIVEFIVDTLGATNFTVFEGMIFTFAILFVVNLFSRLLSFTTPD